MGHTSFSMTLRYAHLVPGAFSEAYRARIALDLSPATGKLVPFRPGNPPSG
jgi:hypothetical protein